MKRNANRLILSAGTADPCCLIKFLYCVQFKKGQRSGMGILRGNPENRLKLFPVAMRFYSYAKASIGSLKAAFNAGYTAPPIAPARASRLVSSIHIGSIGNGSVG